MFDRIDRIEATAETYDCELLIDVNCDLWKVKAGEKIIVTLANSLTGEADDGTYKPQTGPSLLDMCEYAMHGRVYNFEHKEGHRIEIHVSYGGLLMRLTGDQR